MTSIATTVIVIGVFFGIAGWLASPTDSARATRRVAAPVLRDYPGYVYAGLAILVGIYFLSAPVQNLRSFLTTLVIAGLAAFGIRELRKQSHEEFPDARMGDVFGRTKERVTDAVKSAEIGARVSEGVSKLRLPEVRKGGAEKPEAAAQPAADEDARLARLARLGELKEKGILTDEEFAAEKARVLGSGSASV
jgi:hypothetical protein